MTWEKGQSGNLAGRPKGSRNRFTHLRDEFMIAFEEMGGRESLVKWANSNPDQFYKVIVQMLPKERTVDITTRTTTLEDLLVEINNVAESQLSPAHSGIPTKKNHDELG